MYVDKCIHLRGRLIYHTVACLEKDFGQKRLFSFLQRVAKEVEASLLLIKRRVRLLSAMFNVNMLMVFFVTYPQKFPFCNYSDLYLSAI